VYRKNKLANIYIYIGILKSAGCKALSALVKDLTPDVVKTLKSLCFISRQSGGCSETGDKSCDKSADSEASDSSEAAEDEPTEAAGAGGFSRSEEEYWKFVQKTQQHRQELKEAKKKGEKGTYLPLPSPFNAKFPFHLLNHLGKPDVTSFIPISRFHQGCCQNSGFIS
jgi:hypothetical protein